jgi:hypothetical protein
MFTDLESRLSALAAQPSEWRVTTTYADGSSTTRDVHSEAAGKNYAVGESRKIGKKLIDRATGATVQVVSVNVARI